MYIYPYIYVNKNMFLYFEICDIFFSLNFNT